MVHPGPTLASLLPVPSPVATLGREYGGLEVTVEVVESVEAAVDHVNMYGSGHTDCIITEDGERTWYVSDVYTALASPCPQLPLLRGSSLE